MKSSSDVVASLGVDGFHHSTATFLKGNNFFLIFMVHGPEIFMLDHTILAVCIVHLVVYPSLTVKKISRTIKICML